jgi:hypothetical protein
MSIEGVFPRDPADTLFKIHTHLQKWRVRLGHDNLKHLVVTATHMRGWTEAFLEERRRPLEDYLSLREKLALVTGVDRFW